MNKASRMYEISKGLTCVLLLSQKEGRQKSWRYICWKSPNWAKGKNLLISGARRIPNRLSPKKSTPRFIIIKWRKDKDKGNNLKNFEWKRMRHRWKDCDANDCRSLTKTHGGPVTFKCRTKGGLSPRNSISSKNNLQQMKGEERITQMKGNRRCQQLPLKELLREAFWTEGKW